MKTKAYTVRLNLSVEAERKLFDMLENDSESFRSASECIKCRLTDYYKDSSDDIEELIKQSQKELLEQVYDICLKIVNAVGGVTVKPIDVTNTVDTPLPKMDDTFPDNLSDVLDLLNS